MKGNQSLFDITSVGLKKIERVLIKEKPGIVVVQGDTATTFIASLAAYYMKIKVAHVEAGLRTYNKYSPFPEETNRILTTHLADLHFAPTEWAKNNLLEEGVDKRRIFVTGNTVIDALLWIVEKHKSREIQRQLEQKFKKDYGITFDNHKTILVTAHRRESFGRDFRNICYGLKRIVEKNSGVQIVYPVHLNPNVQEPVKGILSHNNRIHLIKPLDYFSLVWLMKKSHLILTDSGGIQEEAPTFGKPVLVMRDTTERPEAILAGTAKLVGTNQKAIINSVIKLLNNKRLYNSMVKKHNPYGDGKASKRIANILSK
jgi:UDP-N-acetylglucosamine 2-epimerase (non-hydrolysing)